ncbi:MAG TPA: response regulator transcription factor [Candidatus Aminicenantes bacterium]|nr:response regulator transcription factor [Candidatus Aminicenantes bacterium]
MKRILVVEDESAIAFGLQLDLKNEGYDVEIASNGESALRHAQKEAYDLILLDVMLPRKDGYEVCRDLRRVGLKTPIIMLTAKTHEAEKVLGLETGADDYVTKPFSPRELRARIKAALRRTAGDDVPAYRFGDAEVDFKRCELRRAGKPVDLTALEFKLLAAFVTDRVVDNHVVTLRKKIEPDPSKPRYIISVRGMGYRFDG